MSPEFLDLDEVVAIHQDQVGRYGGAPGIRDIGALQAAIAMPQAGVFGEYFHTDFFEMAAAYMFHITKNHPFVDGNKRVGAVAALVFLKLNGLDVEASNEVLADFVLSLAEGKAGKADAAVFLRTHARKTVPRRPR